MLPKERKNIEIAIMPKFPEKIRELHRKLYQKAKQKVAKVFVRR
jgi:hypothetical protein